MNNRLKQNIIAVLLALFLAYLLVGYSPVLFVAAIGTIVSVFLIFLYPECFFGLWYGGFFIPAFFFFPMLGSLKGLSFIPLVGVFLYVLKAKRRIFPPVKFNWLIVSQFVFLIIVLLGISWASDKNHAVTVAHHFFSLCLIPFFGVLYFVDDFDRLKRLIYSIVIGAFTLGISGYYFLKSGHFEPGQLTVFQIAPQSYSLAAGIAAIFIISYLFYHKINLYLKLGLFVVLLFLLGGMIISGSRAVLVGTIAGIFVLIISAINLKKLKTIFKIGFGIIFISFLFLSFFYFLPQELTYRHFEALEHPIQIPTSQKRIEIYERNFDSFLEAPLIGQGTGGYRETGWTWPHNIFLECAQSWGVVGLSVFCWFIFLTIRYAFRIVNLSSNSTIHRTLAIFLFSSFVVYIVNAQVNNNIPQNGPIWLYSALIYALYFSRQSKRQNKNERSNYK